MNYFEAAHSRYFEFVRFQCSPRISCFGVNRFPFKPKATAAGSSPLRPYFPTEGWRGLAVDLSFMHTDSYRTILRIQAEFAPGLPKVIRQFARAAILVAIDIGKIFLV